jgi:small multidrug resistance family-3 protein
MTLQTKLVILGLLVVATTLEVSGDAIIRIGLGERAAATKGAYFLAGAVLLFGYGLTLNLAPIEFHRVVGVYIATLFVVWQVISFLVFRSVPTLPIIAGGTLIVLGGFVVAFWSPGSATPAP